jgi:hypothetical protein
MTNSRVNQGSRLIAYKLTRDRVDATKQARKTRTGKLNCTPGNKACGSRCIPQNWDCRLEGQGTNSELKVYKNDPLAGIASVQRGSKDVTQGILQGDPSKIERGRNSVIRGIVKLTPGDNLEDKKELRRKLTELSTPIAAVIGIGVVGLGAHAGMKRTFQWYRQGVGRDIDTAAFRSIDTVLDQLPIVGRNREARRVAGANAVGAIANTAMQGARLGNTRSASALNTRKIGPLSFRSLAGDTTDSGLINNLNKINNQARSNTIGFEEWKSQSVQALYGATSPGARSGGVRGSIFSEQAANEFLVSKFRLNSNGIVGRSTTASIAARNSLLEDELAGRLGQWREAMQSDMRLRRFAPREGNITVRQANRYISQVAAPRLRIQLANLTTEQGRRAASEGAALMRTVLTSDNQNTTARALRREAVSQYDTYFNNVAQSMTQSVMSSSSPFGDGATGLARFLSRRSGSNQQILSREYADLQLRDYYQSRVMNLSNNYRVSESTARRLAQQINRSTELPNSAEALRILNTNGFPRASYRGSTLGEAPPKPPTLTDLTTRILGRRGNENMSRAAAMRQARRERDSWLLRRAQRTDEAPPRVLTHIQYREDNTNTEGKGQPCGESHIPKDWKCTKKVQKKSKKEDKTKPEGPKIPYAQIAIAGLYGLSIGAQIIDAKQTLRNEKFQKLRNSPLKPKNLNPDQFATALSELKNKPGVNNNTIDQISKFVKDANITVETDIKSEHSPGVRGFWTPSKPNTLHVPILSEDIARSFTTNFDRINKTTNGLVSTPNRLGLFRNWGVSSSYKFGSSEQFFSTSVHELGHALHGRMALVTPKAVTLNGKRYEGAALERELRKTITTYGSSDINRGRLETYAEYFSMYVMSGDTLKKKNPVAWAWTKSITDYALKQDPYMDSRIQAAANRSIANSQKTDSRMDSAPNTPEELLKRAQELAVSGKPKELRKLVSDYKNDLTFDQYNVIGSLFETAVLYAYQQQIGEQEPMPEVNITTD